jgi:DmsE family decaheme c-type cytochrome
MKKLIYTLALGAVVAGLGLGTALPAAAGDPSEDCATCHDEIAANFAHTVHAAKDRGGPTCATCHGNGDRHMEEGGEAALIGKPEGQDLETLCLTCHRDVQTMFSRRSVHSGAEVTCISCHNIHTTDPLQPQMLRQAANQLCASCHSSSAGSFNQPFGHRLDLGGMQCVSCHNPHGGAGEASLKVDRSGDIVCYSCHAEKRGPFVFSHVMGGVSGTCLTCHVPHGASNPMALTRARVDQLCLECHSPMGNTLGSQPPSFHNLTSPRYQNCTTCHVMVHGSNTSPMLLK